MPQLGELIRQGIAHKGFAFIDVLQICASFFNMTDYYQSRVYDLAGHNAQDFGAACAKAREWDYNRDAPISLGIFYEQVFPTFNDRAPARHMSREKRSHRIRDLFETAK